MSSSEKNIKNPKKSNITKGLKRNVRLDSLDPKMNPRVRREHVDADYLKTLPEDVYKWYAQFIDEYVNAIDAIELEWWEENPSLY